mmetsp:Transcript_27746/g.66938  ORF Transcript_27746/g.66938 Transcript_27746/m.66938 type:complete len:2336 (-) Transcript_27746:142-7149(-)
MKKASKKQRTTTPIVLPHDGPVSHWYYYEQHQQQPNGGEEEKRVDYGPPLLIRQALSLLYRTDAFVNDGSSLAKEKNNDNGGGEDEDEEKDHETATISSQFVLEQRCIKLCCDLRSGCYHDNDIYNSKGRKHEANSSNGKTIKTKTTTKEQLQHLQAFKCWMLENIAGNTKKNAKKNTGNCSDSYDGEDIGGDGTGSIDDLTANNSNQNMQVLIGGLYRLLLEWSLSNQTPVPFQRAIQSNLKTIIDIDKTNTNNKHNTSDQKEDNCDDGSKSTDVTNRDVLVSIWSGSSLSTSSKRCCYWKDPIHSLDVAVNFPTLLAIIQTDQQLWYDCLQFLLNQLVSLQQNQEEKTNQPKRGKSGSKPAEEEKNDGVECTTETSSSSLALSSHNELQTALRVVNTIKLLLGSSSQICRNSNNSNNIVDADPAILIIRKLAQNRNEATTEAEPSGRGISDLLSNLQNTTLMLSKAPNMLMEGFNSLGIVYGRLVFLRSFCAANDDTRNSNVDDGTELTLVSARNLLAETCFETIQRLIDGDVIIDDQSSSMPKQTNLSALARLSIVQGLVATTDMETMMTSKTAKKNQSTQEEEQSIVLFHACWKYTLHTGRTSTDPMVRWASIKGLSTLSTRLIQQRNQNSNQPTGRTNDFDEEREMALINETLQFVFDSWENPPMRKVGTAIPGLFRSIVQLVPESRIPDISRTVLSQPVNRKGRYSALECLLPYLSFVPGGLVVSGNEQTSPFDIETLLEGIGDRGPNSVAIANLWIKILNQMLNEVQDDENLDEKEPFPRKLVLKWFDLWMPSFCSAVMGCSLNRRKQVMTYCLPRVTDLMREDKKLKIWSSFMIGSCIEQIGETKNLSSLSTTSSDVDESLPDRILWAQLEITRLSSTMKVSGTEHHASIGLCLPKQRFDDALAHHLPPIRLSALRSIESVVMIYNGNLKTQEEILRAEVSIWKTAILVSLKSQDSKDYDSILLQSLCIFMDRLSTSEAAIANNSFEGASVDLSVFKSFVIDFLVREMVLSQTAYPGTTADKESISISLIDCLIAFAIQDERFVENNSLPANGTMFIRTRAPIEVAAMHDILSALISQEVFSVLMGLVHSVWDNTRASASAVLSKLVMASQKFSLELPQYFGAENDRKFLLARGVHMASSPRQREADTGAHLLLFLYASTQGLSSRLSFMRTLLQMSTHRIKSMSDILERLLDEPGEDDRRGEGKYTGTNFPLAYGIVHAIRLCVDHDRLETKLGQIRNEEICDGFFDETIQVCTRALKLSLSVVSDVHVDDVETENGNTSKSGSIKDSTPLNVNTGAIGANGTFSGVACADQSEAESRLAVQRVVVGTWLLTKESTATLATVISLPTYGGTYELVSDVGGLLLSTLTTLKHAGAAFAARDALQEIALACFSVSKQQCIGGLPAEWSRILMDEISLNERVRNSTLRRSTGYALGFVAILRAEIKATNSRSIGKDVLSQLVKMSLPPENILSAELESLGLQGIDSFDFTFKPLIGPKPFVLDNEYEERRRVHALNILRLIILEAPLVSLVGPYIGDMMISAVFGYRDRSWSIRNSSTMVFSSAMLRVVDTDKNASNSDRTSSNAISISELFRRYPALQTFIPAALTACVVKMENDGTVESQLFPILLLLSRIQPVAKCNDSSIEISNQYHSALLRCLGSKDSSIRDVAARSVAVMCCGTTTGIMVTKLGVMLKDVLRRSRRRDYNLVDGCLLALEKLVSSNNVENFSLSSHITDQNSEMNSMLRHIVRDPYCPPTCRATAIRIIQGGDEILLPLYESLIDEGPTNVDNGYTILQAQIGEALCAFYEKNLWNLASGKRQLSESLRSLQCLFSSNEIDIRLASIKAFKKGLPEKLRKLKYIQQSSSDSNVCCEEVVEALGAMLIDCVSVESNRSCMLGGHPSSLRRLSRCFLDVIEACSQSSFGDILLAKNDLLWTTSCDIVNDFGGPERTEPDGSTSLAANGVEMMAVHFLIAHHKDNGNVFPDRVERMISIIEHLNDPLSSCRSRYSSATALEQCHPIWSKTKNDTNFSSLHHRALLCILKMLQDSDPDVRSAAVRAATKYSITMMDGSEILSSSAPSNVAGSLLPEWTLKTFFPLVFNLSDNSTAPKTLKDIVQIVLDGSKGILDVIRTLQFELRPSSIVKDDNPGYLEQLINKNSNRAIFEIEDPNPNLERLLVSQLAARTVLNNTSNVDSLLSSTTSLSTDVLDLFILCNDVLDQLKNSLNEGGMIHDISRFPSVFPSLHGLLCFVATLACSRGGTDTKKWDADGDQGSSSSSVVLSQVVESATYVVKHGKYVHPEIITALRVVSGQEQLDSMRDTITFLLRNDE